MIKDDQPSVIERRIASNRVFRMAIGTSLIFHVLILVFWRVVAIPASPLSAAGPNAGDFEAAGGGMQSVNLRVAASRPMVRPRVPVLTLDDVEPVVFDAEPQLDLAVMGGEGPGSGEGPPGLEGGRGRGDGGTGAQGFFDLTPPSPRGMIIPPSNKSLKGKEVDIWVFVDARGRVVADSTRLNPPTSDRGFNRRLIAEAAEWLFNPAKRKDQPVSAWFYYNISM